MRKGNATLGICAAPLKEKGGLVKGNASTNGPRQVKAPNAKDVKGGIVRDRFHHPFINGVA